jgi:uncharacterized membrane protein YcaP (DUF421 family)
MNTPIFFESWWSILRAVILAALGFASYVAMLRAAGKRSIAKMNVFDFTFVVAIGSTLANLAVSPNVALLTAIAALGSLLGVQMLFARVTVRSARLEKWINGEPVLLFHRGAFLHEVMRREKVTEEELRGAARDKGFGSLTEIAAIVLETDGIFTVLGREHAEAVQQSTLCDVPNWRDRVA